MVQETTGSSDPRVQMLSAYRDTTRQILVLLNSTEGDQQLVDVDGLDQLLVERDRLIASYSGQSLPQSSDPAVEKLVAEIQQLENLVKHRLSSLHHATSTKLAGLQGQKRGMEAYGYENQHQRGGAAFIDHRK
jgi:hypothetical protein